MLITAIAALLAVGQAAAGPVAKRTTETVQIFAFGAEISSYNIYAGSDGLAYIVSDDTLTNMTALTWTVDTTGTDAWTVQPNTTATPSNSTTTSLVSGSAFYVVTSDGAYEQAGFVQNTSDAPAGAVTTGFVMYGPYVMLLEEDVTSGHEMYVSEFWAANSSVEGVWALMWNEAGAAQDNGLPVTLRTRDLIVD